MNEPTPVQGYAAAAPAYRHMGWTQVIPLPSGAKFPPPKNTTGGTQRPVTDTQVAQWSQAETVGRPSNVGVVMPEGVIAIDVDRAEGHERKQDGALTLIRLERELGPLPATWTSGHENADSPYRHRFYRVPSGLEFDGGAGEGIDILQHHHRYAVAWPSTHPNGSTYRWMRPDGTVYEGVPHVMWLPDLPDAWVRRLRKKPTPTEPRRVETRPTPRMEQDPRMCRAINTYLNRLLADPAVKGSRHDTMLHAAWALIRFQEEGHRGALDALAQLKPYFIQATAPDRKGGEREAEREYTAIVATALAKNTGVQGVSDPCELSRMDRLTQREADMLRRNRTQQAWDADAQASDGGYADDAPDAEDAAGETDERPTRMTADDDTWRFLDLTRLAQGEELPPQPTVFEREDGQGLFYRECVNDIHGEPGSGKSMIAQAAVAQELKHGRHVLYLDYEDRARNVVKRLLLMGVSAESITRRLHYVNPQSSNTAVTGRDGWTQTLEYARDASLCIIDGVTASLAYSGCDSNDSDDVVAWYNLIPRPVARMGAAVVLIDHVVKTKDNRGRYASGSMQKLAQIDGVSYAVGVDKPIGKGLKGLLVLRSGKDRIGDIEERCAPGWSDGHLREAARITVDSTDPSRMRIQVGIPNRMPRADGQSAEPFRPSGLMERISRILEDSVEEPTQTDVCSTLKDDGSSARKAVILRALKTLIDEEYIASRVGTRGRIHYRTLRPYRQRDDPESDAYEDRLTSQEADAINRPYDDEDDPDF